MKRLMDFTHTMLITKYCLFKAYTNIQTYFSRIVIKIGNKHVKMNLTGLTIDEYGANAVFHIYITQYSVVRDFTTFITCSTSNLKLYLLFGKWLICISK